MDLFKPDWTTITVTVRPDRKKLLQALCRVKRQSLNAWINSQIDNGLPDLAAEAERCKAKIRRLVNTRKKSGYNKRQD